MRTTPLALDYGEVKPTDKPFQSRITLSVLDASGKLLSRPALASNGLAILRVELDGVLNEGEWRIPILNGKDVVDELTISNGHVNFDVKLDMPDQSNPEIVFGRDEPSFLTIKNDDGVPYSVQWAYLGMPTLACGGIRETSGAACDAGSGKSSNRAPPSAVQSPPDCDLKLPAHSSREVQLFAPREWFQVPAFPRIELLRLPHYLWQLVRHPLDSSSRIAGPLWARVRVALKDDVKDARIRVQLCSRECGYDSAAPSRIFPVKTRLTAFSKDKQVFWGYVIVFLTLLAGGVTSLLVNFFLPMQERRLRVKQRLAEADRKVGDLTVELDSRVRVPLGVERRRLSVRLRTLGILNPQFSQDMTDIEQGIDRLLKRLDYVERMQKSLRVYWALRKRDIPVRLIDQIEGARQRMADILQKTDPTDADLQEVVGANQELDRLIITASQPNMELAKRLVDELSRRKAELTAVPPAGPLAAALPPEFAPAVILLTSELNILPANVDALLPQDYGRIDRVLFKLNLLEQYQKIQASTPSAKPYAKRASDRLARELQRDTWDALGLARGLVRELQEDIFPEDVIAEVEDHRVDVKVDRIVVRQFELVQMRLDFRNDAVHSSSARSEFTYRWDFDHDNLTENGWTVSHYFPYTSRPRIWALIRQVISQLNTWVREKLPILHLMGGTDQDFVSVYRGPYRVSATLIQNWDGLVAPSGVPMEHPLGVERPAPISTAPIITETMRLCLVLGLAVLGLIAGAKEQLLKLDVFPALVAIFLVGFGADQIKNLLSQRPQS